MEAYSDVSEKIDLPVLRIGRMFGFDAGLAGGSLSEIPARMARNRRKHPQQGS